MNYVLFLGGRIGLEALLVITSHVKVGYVFVEKEHAHEHAHYSSQITEVCDQKKIGHDRDLSPDRVLAMCHQLKPDYLMCFGYRRMIPADVIATARIGCIGSHFAPLPRYRGFAPLNWVLINGEPSTAVNVFFLVDEVDAGDILAQKKIEITEQDDINTLTEKCVAAMPGVLKDALVQLESGNPVGEPQDHTLATYTCSRNPDDGLIDWSQSSKAICNLVRALTYPWPGAYTYYKGKKLYVWKCEEHEELPYEGRICGKIIKIRDGALKVLTGDGSIWITQCSSDPDDPIVNDFAFNSIRVTLGV